MSPSKRPKRLPSSAIAWESPTTRRRRRESSRRSDDSIPLYETVRSRTRGRRGGTPVPFLLLVVIAVVSGVALAYVAQTARAAQLTYAVTSLTAQQHDLMNQEQKLAGQLDLLSSAERITAAAQQMGMQPARKWSYVHPSTVAVVTPAGPSEVRSNDSQNHSNPVLGDTLVRQ